MKRFVLPVLALLLVPVPSLRAFCGFYVAKADTRLFNKASQVALVRDGEKTVMTMANDFHGDPKEFAIVVPVPTFVSRGQIHVGDKALLDHLDAYSSPRLVEYFDGDPCALAVMEAPMAMKASGMARDEVKDMRAKSLGVRVEARYTVGEYDIVILSATQSNGLETWLRGNGYRIPAGASRILQSYIGQKMHFFVARVNLKEQEKLGFSYLRPLQVAYDSPKFMLPILLGTVNASGTQELFVYALTRKGRVETTNYRTVKLPSDAEVPLFVKDEFGKFYKAMFGRQTESEKMSVVFLEYAWDMSWCDPCAADPLSRDEMRQLGVFWLGDTGASGSGSEVFLTRLHVRYDGAHFPEDLVFQETGDRNNFQGRFILRHPWTGSTECAAGLTYRNQLRKRNEEQAHTLAGLTGWDLAGIRQRMHIPQVAAAEEKPRWWSSLWK